MDKELIINKIDVSKCEHRQGITCIVSQHDFCDKHPNCYFKQLARAREEIEKLKEELEQIKLLLNNGEIELVNRLLRYNRAINAIEELAKNNDKVNSTEIEKIIKRIEK